MFSLFFLTCSGMKFKLEINPRRNTLEMEYEHVHLIRSGVEFKLAMDLEIMNVFRSRI